MIMSKLKDIIFWKLRGEVPLWAYKARGMKTGDNVNVEPGSYLDYDHCWLIEIGNNVTLAADVRVLAHDASTKKMLGYAKIGRVTIGNDVFIGSGSIILPGIKIGDNVIIGAGSVVTKNVEQGTIVAGNPAKVIGYTNTYMEKNKLGLDKKPKFNEDYTVRKSVTDDKKLEMKSKLENTIGYVE
jgi:maltose O-acetyltransferase